MGKLSGLIKIGLIGSLLYSQIGVATAFDELPIDSEGKAYVGPTDQVITSQWTVLGESESLDNHGRITLAGFYSDGLIDNYGKIRNDGIFALGTGHMLNHPDGRIYLFGSLDLIANQGLFENAGTTIIGPAYTSGDLLMVRHFKGTIKNTGTMIFDRPGGSGCADSSMGEFVNEGRLEIGNDTTCYFSGGSTYTQNSGEIMINGNFGADEIQINKGILGGNGTIRGIQFNPFGGLRNTVTIAPGAPIGNLSVEPAESVRCDGCSIDIELAGDNQFDQLHIVGELDVVRWKLNVSLRDGYIPAPGKQFSVISADVLVRGEASATTYNLPKLPNGRTWSVQNNVNEIILVAN